MVRGLGRDVAQDLQCCSDMVVKWRWRVGVAMSERRKKTKKESLNEVGSRTGGVGGDVGAYKSRWGCHREPWPKPRELVVWGLACRDGMASGRGFRVAGYWWWWMSRETGPRAYVWRGGGVAAAVTWFVEAELVVVSWSLACRDGMAPGRAFARRGTDGGGVRDDVKQKKRKRKNLAGYALGSSLHVRVTIVVAVGIVGDEMHEVAPLEKTLLVENEQGTVVFREQPKVRINAIGSHLTDHVTAAATLWPRLHQPPPRRAKAHPDAMPSRHLYRLSQTTSPLQLPHHFTTHRLMAPSPSTSTTTSTSPRKSPPRCHAVATHKTPADDDELGFRLYCLSQTTSPLQLPHRLATHRLVAPSPSTPTTTSTPPREIPTPTPCRRDDGTPNATRKPRHIASNTTRLHVKPRPMHYATITPARHSQDATAGYHDATTTLPRRPTARLHCGATSTQRNTQHDPIKARHHRQQQRRRQGNGGQRQGWQGTCT
ncbi:hypothetical protein EDB89DRAFT_1904974 [Lactarius sanguifluus]|nr:hypothetical protein EDB89DRAFT_1904974 [Lactarius sanguifluus]